MRIEESSRIPIHPSIVDDRAPTVIYLLFSGNSRTIGFSVKKIKASQGEVELCALSWHCKQINTPLNTTITANNSKTRRNSYLVLGMRKVSAPNNWPPRCTEELLP